MSLQEFPDFDAAVRARLELATKELCQEFDGLYEREQVQAVLDESARQLQRGEVAAYVHVLAQRFARERLRALAQNEGRLAKPTTEVLFVSLTGGGRAQIAAALLARRAGGVVQVHTAGSDLGGGIDENVAAAMAEVGIDLTEAFTKPLSPEVLSATDIVVTMGRSVGAIDVPGETRHVDWRVGDPAGAELDEVRRVRDDIDRRVEQLAAELVDRAAHAAAPQVSGR